MRALLLRYVALLAISSTAFAQTSTKGIQYTPRAAIPCDPGTSCMWTDIATNQVQFFDGTTAKTMPTIVTSAKGDIAVWNGTTWQKLAVGANTNVLTANSATATGLQWSAGGGSTGNYSFNLNAMDLTGAATMSIAPTTATAITLGQNTTIAGSKTFTTGTGAALFSGTTNSFTNGAGIDSSHQNAFPAVNASTYAVLGATQNYTAAQNVENVPLSDGAHISTNANLGNTFTVTIAASRIIDNPTNLPPTGGTFQWEIVQGGAGSNTITWGSVFKWPGSSAPTLLTAIGAKDLITCQYDGTDLLCGSLAGSSVTYLPLAGGTMTGPITFNGTQNGTYTLGGTVTINAPLLTGGITSSINNSPIDFSSSTGPQKTSTGTFTFSGAAISCAANTVITTASSATNTTGFTLISNAADGASSVGQLFETTTAIPSGKVFRYNNGTGAEVYSLLSSFGSTVHELRAATGIFGFRNNTTTGVLAQTNTNFFYSGGTAYETMDSGGILPNTDLGVPSGSASKRWTQSWAQVYGTVKGNSISSTGVNVTIAPTSGITHITGTGIIQTITVPVTSFVGCLDFIPDAAFTTTTGGNIALASTAVVSRVLRECFDGTSWYPSY